MSSVWWVRHGPTHELAFVGWRDVPADLSDTAALARLSAYLPARAALISSDLTRAVATADALAAPGRARLAPDPGLREFDFGTWDGMAFPEVAARDPELSRAFWAHPGTVAPPGGESWNTVEARVSAAIDALAAEHETIIVVAHLGAILTQVGRALGAEAALSHRLDPLSVTRLSRAAEGWRLAEVNHRP